MSRTLEGPRRVGDIWIAAVVETQVKVAGHPGGCHGSGAKTPTALAVHDGHMMLVFAGDGRQMTEQELDALYPGSGARLRAAAGYARA